MDRKNYNVLCCGILLTSILCMSACTEAETPLAVPADDLGILESSFVINHPLINENPLFLFRIGDMIKAEQVILKEDFSEKTEAGYLHCYIDDGITCVTGEPSGKMKEEYKTLLGVILTSDK